MSKKRELSAAAVVYAAREMVAAIEQGSPMVAVGLALMDEAEFLAVAKCARRILIDHARKSGHMSVVEAYGQTGAAA